MEQSEGGQSASAYDLVAAELIGLRGSAGLPSYAEIALRVGRLREGRGVPRAEARPGRTTVYDAFRLGRRRFDANLVVDIARVLGADEDTAARLATTCRQEREAREAHRLARASEVDAAPKPAPVVPQHVGEAIPWRRGLLTAAACLVLNLVLAGFVNLIKLPLFLDMVGTALAAIVLGPWWGAGVGLATNLGMAATQGPKAIPFALVNVAGALMWGYGVRRFRMGNGLPRFFVLNLLVGLGCTIIAAPIVYLVFGGTVGHGSESVMERVLAMSHHLLLAVASANLLTSLVDKVLSGFLTLVAVEAMPIALATGRDHLHLIPVADVDAHGDGLTDPDSADRRGS